MAVIVPCHRIIRGDGTWGHYAFGGEMKTQLLRLERSTPAIVGCTSTRIVCRRGCAHEQRVREANRVVLLPHLDADLAAGGSEFDGVGQQVEHKLLQLTLVGHDGAQSLLNFAAQLHTMARSAFLN